MANTIQYGMGQIRYNSTSTYMSRYNFYAEPINVLVSSDNLTDVYQDVILKRVDSTDFVANKPYLLKITIPKDLNYNNTYRIKLVAAGSDTITTLDPDTVTYQMLKYVNVPKETSSASSSRVIIYPVTTIEEEIDGEIIPEGSLGMNSDGSYKTMVAIAVDKENVERPDGVYFNNNKYYLAGEESSEDQEIQNKNDVILNHTWTSGHSISGVDFSFIFTPRSSDESYNQIWIELFRETYDQDIFSEGIYGRKIDLSSGIFKAEVYELTNLISGIEDVDTLTHVGVYGHPNTIMAINGEEIRIGQSGYYELNNFDITSFGIAAGTNDDRFIVDYQYQTIIE